MTERTREIGVRKALGAKQRDVLMQFLIESGLLALIGGFFGVMGGVLVGKLITIFVGFPTAVPVWAIFLGLFLAVCGGHFLRRVSGQQSRKTRPGGGVARRNVREAAVASSFQLLAEAAEG